MERYYNVSENRDKSNAAICRTNDLKEAQRFAFSHQRETGNACTIHKDRIACPECGADNMLVIVAGCDNYFIDRCRECNYVN